MDDRVAAKVIEPMLFQTSILPEGANPQGTSSKVSAGALGFGLAKAE